MLELPEKISIKENVSIKRLDYVDIGKSISLFLVIFSHCEGRIISKYYTIAFISLFFFLSGYTFRKKERIFDDITKKAKRLLIPYFIFTILLILLYNDSFFNIFNAFVNACYSRYCLYPLGTSNNIYFLVSGNMVLWFLTAMFSSYLFFLFSIHIKGGVLFNFILAYFLTYLPILLPWSIDTAPLFAVFIFIGNYWRKHEFYSTKILIFSLVAYFIICILNGGANPSVRVFGRSYLLFFLGSLASMYFFIHISKMIENTIFKKSLTQIGRYSLTIFCLQLPLLNLLSKITNFVGLPHSIVFDILIGSTKSIIVIILLFPIAKLLHKIIPDIF